MTGKKRTVERPPTRLPNLKTRKSAFLAILRSSPHANLFLREAGLDSGEEMRAPKIKDALTACAKALDALGPEAQRWLGGAPKSHLQVVVNMHPRAQAIYFVLSKTTPVSENVAEWVGFEQDTAKILAVAAAFLGITGRVVGRVCKFLFGYFEENGGKWSKEDAKGRPRSHGLYGATAKDIVLIDCSS